MACVELPSNNADSEMEEGEIVDDLDDLSDISSEEEFLLRQRLQVLENYNNVLERTKAKQISLGEDGVLKVECKLIKSKHTKLHHKHKKSEHKKQVDRGIDGKLKGHKKKNVNRRKKSETSEDSDDDYRNKRQKLADAVSLNKPKSDTSTLKDRISKMLSGNKTVECIGASIYEKPIERRKSENDVEVCDEVIEQDTPTVISVTSSKSSECIVSSIAEEEKKDVNTEETAENKCVPNSGGSSDEDIELLRQNALQTKSSKSKQKNSSSNENKVVVSSEDEDSDTEELRMICLKSALLKKAIEMKQKQKLKKRLSQSNTLQNELEFGIDLNSCENHTDVESVDMDIGSDGDDKVKENIKDSAKTRNRDGNCETKIEQNKQKEEETEEDEDLLRAKLLTSLSKNLPNLIDVNVLNTVTEDKGGVINKKDKTKETKQANAKEEKKFIIQLGGSDSEGEHEATKNLTKMHMKLSEQEEFQRKLDIFLKESRMQVEKNILPDVVQPPPQKPIEKFVPKVMNSLPRSEQIEYKNLVKRMAELEKIKNARQSLLSMGNKLSYMKDTLKPSNTVKDSNINSIELDERIAASRRKIANESATMLKLKEEATKLSQKYKMLQIELNNIRNAIRINKTHQRTVHNGLSISRLQHQNLLKSLTKFKHSNQTPTPLNRLTGKTPINKLQKENDPSLKDINNSNSLKAVKVSVVNDLNNDVNSAHQRLSVQVDIANNKKVVKLPNTVQERIVNFTDKRLKEENVKSNSDKSINKANERCGNSGEEIVFSDSEQIMNDYKSPLEAFKSKSWEADPNAFLCPFEVGGSCRDPDCKYLHPKIPTTQ